MNKDKTEEQSKKVAFEVTKESDNSIKITITVPWKEVNVARQQVIEELTKNVALSGFRTGKVPQHIAAEKLDKEKVNEELLKKILPTSYAQAVKEHDLKPIIHPRVHIGAFDEGTDLVFTAETCEEPTVDLGNYKEEVKKVTATSKIVIPGREQTKPDIEKIIDAALQSVRIVIPKLLVEQEVNRLLSQLLDELKTLGVSLDQYLASRGKTGETLRTEYGQKAERDLKLEFTLRKIADVEHIVVEQADIDKVITSLKDENQKKELSQNPYLVAPIIRQQKTLDFLTTL